MFILMSSNNINYSIEMVPYPSLADAQAAMKIALNSLIAEYGCLDANSGAESAELVCDNKDLYYWQIKELSENMLKISDRRWGRPWATEAWYDEDLKNALEYRQIEATAENIEQLKGECTGIFDDKSARNEMIDEVVCRLFPEADGVD